MWNTKILKIQCQVQKLYLPDSVSPGKIIYTLVSISCDGINDCLKTLYDERGFPSTLYSFCLFSHFASLQFLILLYMSNSVKHSSDRSLKVVFTSFHDNNFKSLSKSVISPSKVYLFARFSLQRMHLWFMFAIQWIDYLS